MKKFLVISALSLAAATFTSHCQEDVVRFEMAGFYLYTEYSKEDIINNLGEPDNYHRSVAEEGITQTFHYEDKIYIQLSDNIISVLNIRTDLFSVRTTANVRFRVGDRLEDFIAKGITPLEKINDERYRVLFCNDDYFHINVKDGVITTISFVMSV